MQSMHSSWFGSPVATTIGVALAVSLDFREVPHGAESDLVEDYSGVVAVVELRDLGVLCQAYAEELVDCAAVLFVVARPLVRRADEEDLAPPQV